MPAIESTDKLCELVHLMHEALMRMGYAAGFMLQIMYLFPLPYLAALSHTQTHMLLRSAGGFRPGGRERVGWCCVLIPYCICSFCTN